MNWLNSFNLDSRYVYILRTGLIGLIAKASSFLSIFCVAHMLFGHWDAAHFGVLATLQSLSLAMVFADFGLGSSLVNEIIRLRIADDMDGIRMEIARVQKVYILLAVVLVAVFGVGGFAFAGKLSGQIEGLNTVNSGLLILYVGGVYAVQVYCGIAQRINYAINQNYRNHYHLIAGNILQIFLVWLGIQFAFSFYVIIVVVLMAPALSLVLNYCVTFYLKNSEFRPRHNLQFDLSLFRGMGASVSFLMINLFSIAAFSLDVPLITTYAGAALAGVFAINQRLFSVANQVAEPFLQLLWPTFQAGIEKNDHRWVKQAFTRSLAVVGVVTCMASCVIIFLYNYLINKYFNSTALLHSSDLAGFIVWGLAGGLGGVVSAAISTQQLVYYQLRLVIVAAIVSLTLKFCLLGSTNSIGVVVWVNALATALVIVLPGIYKFNQKLDKCLIT